MAIEDAILTADAVELEMMELRVLTERALQGTDPWPHFMRLVVGRATYAGNGAHTEEVGEVRRDRYGTPEPIVYHGGGRIRVRRYACLEQLLDAGWRLAPTC